jgi:hypothetical protein
MSANKISLKQAESLYATQKLQASIEKGGQINLAASIVD